MKFNGELKFPEVDHPGVPVVFLIDGSQAEILVEGESLGRWSLYDIHARRLVANAFLIDLEGTEVTFVADDPIDFAYRGVDHMAKTWADIKSKRIARRAIAVRKSRKGVTQPRVEDLRAAMQQNLHSVDGPRRLAGEPGEEQDPAAPSPVDRIMTTPPDRHAPAADSSDTVVDEAPVAEELGERHAFEDWDQRDAAGQIPLASDEAEQPVTTRRTAEELEIEAARRQLAEERARLEAERRAAEEREANLVQAYKLEMERLAAEREQIRLEAAARSSESMPGPEPEPVAEELEVEEVVPDPEPEPVPSRSVVDLNDIETPEHKSPVPPVSDAEPMPEPEPEPALAAAGRDRRSGIMGAVKAAFGTGTQDHTHSFIEAPGGLGITRYVCEDCGYVSISTSR